MATCNGCQVDRDASEYHPSRPDKCKPCLAAAQRAYRKKRPKGYWQHKDKRYSLKKKYGLTLEQYEQMVSDQGGKCAICLQDPNEQYEFESHQLLHVDHCHATGRVRALLCNGCNRALGFINDNHETAIRLASYIKAYDSCVSSNEKEEQDGEEDGKSQ